MKILTIGSMFDGREVVAILNDSILVKNGEEVWNNLEFSHEIVEANLRLCIA